MSVLVSLKDECIHIRIGNSFARVKLWKWRLSYGPVALFGKLELLCA